MTGAFSFEIQKGLETAGTNDFTTVTIALENHFGRISAIVANHNNALVVDAGNVGTVNANIVSLVQSMPWTTTSYLVM